MTCVLGRFHANLSRQAAWSVQAIEVPVLIAYVAGRAECAKFWSVLADLAISVVVPESACTDALAQQPLVSWHAQAGGGDVHAVRR